MGSRRRSCKYRIYYLHCLRPEPMKKRQVCLQDQFHPFPYNSSSSLHVFMCFLRYKLLDLSPKWHNLDCVWLTSLCFLFTVNLHIVHYCNVSNTGKGPSCQEEYLSRLASTLTLLGQPHVLGSPNARGPKDADSVLPWPASPDFVSPFLNLLTEFILFWLANLAAFTPPPLIHTAH